MHEGSLLVVPPQVSLIATLEPVGDRLMAPARRGPWPPAASCVQVEIWHPGLTFAAPAAGHEGLGSLRVRQNRAAHETCRTYYTPAMLSLKPGRPRSCGSRTWLRSQARKAIKAGTC